MSKLAAISESTFRRISEDKLRAAIDRGEFDNLPGFGKPSPLIDQPYHPLWWVMRKIHQEQLLPETPSSESKS